MTSSRFETRIGTNGVGLEAMVSTKLMTNVVPKPAAMYTLGALDTALQVEPEKNSGEWLLFPETALKKTSV